MVVEGIILRGAMLEEDCVEGELCQRKVGRYFDEVVENVEDPFDWFHGLDAMEVGCV